MVGIRTITPRKKKVTEPPLFCWQTLAPPISLTPGLVFNASLRGTWVVSGEVEIYMCIVCVLYVSMERHIRYLARVYRMQCNGPPVDALPKQSGLRLFIGILSCS